MNSSQQRFLKMQGFDRMDSTAGIRRAAMLRWTPAACTSLVVIGLVVQSPLILGVTAAFALFGSLFPKAHPLDVIYNVVGARLFRTGPLPPNPAPRRFAAGIKSLPLGFAALLMQAGQWELATAIGGALAVVGLLAAVTYWDLGSWIYRTLTRRSVSGYASQVLVPVAFESSRRREREDE